MRITYDSEVDALYIELKSLEPGTAENRELSKDIIANYGPDGKLAGLEILNASTVVGETLKKLKPLPGNLLDIGGSVKISNQEKPIQFRKVREEVKRKLAKKIIGKD
jgi:uncharacterized protein YuzE